MSDKSYRILMDTSRAPTCLEVDEMTAAVHAMTAKIADQKATIERLEAERVCTRSTVLMAGCVVFMKGESKLPGYGNAQCIQEVNEHLGEISLYGHNQHYKTHYIARILSYPLVEPPKQEGEG